jgi:hypothetical protein
MTSSLTERQDIHSFYNRYVIWSMPVTALLMVIAVAIGLKAAFKWPLVHDAPLIHYVIFLMAHGFAPYRDIVEMNMPGTYIVEWTVMHVFGPGALGWWLWDAFSGLTAITASAWIAGKGEKQRTAGITGGALAYLFHLRDGPSNLGQRDWIVAVLLLVAFGFLFTSIRRLQPLWMAGSMAAFGCAASIKPPALVMGIFFFLAACWVIRSRQEQGKPNLSKFVLWALLGGLAPALACATFLLWWGSAGNFLMTLQGLVPYYAGLQRLTYATLIWRAIVLKPIMFGAFLIFLLAKSWRRWESAFLAAGVLAGAMLFIVQGKGWSYHLYPEVVFASLWAMIELSRALYADRWQRIVAFATLLLIVLFWTPRTLRDERASTYPDATLRHLEQDLNELGGSALSGKVQCLDMTMGSCINVLYRMRLVQSTGFIYDFYLFPQKNNALTSGLQTRFIKKIISSPPQLIIVSSHTWPGDVQGYEQMANFPVLMRLLTQRYQLNTDFVPPSGNSSGYRIYVLKNNMLDKPMKSTGSNSTGAATQHFPHT